MRALPPPLRGRGERADARPSPRQREQPIEIYVLFQVRRQPVERVLDQRII